MNGDEGNGHDGGWVEGARLALVAVLSAVVAATLVIQVGAAVLDDRTVQAQPRVTLASH